MTNISYHYINMLEEHNKFWSISLDITNKTVTRSWGRIGSYVQTKTDSFSTESEVYAFDRKQRTSRVAKGYVLTNELRLQQLQLEARVIGSGNKCAGFLWLELLKTADVFDIMKPIPLSRLNEPDCEPAALIDIEIRKPIDGNRFFVLFLSSFGVYEVGEMHRSRETNGVFWVPYYGYNGDYRRRSGCLTMKLFVGSNYHFSMSAAFIPVLHRLPTCEPIELPSFVLNPLSEKCKSVVDMVQGLFALKMSILPE
jgi:predicted DNA-binding WGR domain protein